MEEEAQLAKKMPAWSELKKEYDGDLSFKGLAENERKIVHSLQIYRVQGEDDLFLDPEVQGHLKVNLLYFGYSTKVFGRQ